MKKDKNSNNNEDKKSQSEQNSKVKQCTLEFSISKVVKESLFLSFISNLAVFFHMEIVLFLAVLGFIFTATLHSMLRDLRKMILDRVWRGEVLDKTATLSVIKAILSGLLTILIVYFLFWLREKFALTEMEIYLFFNFVTAFLMVLWYYFYVVKVHYKNVSFLRKCFGDDFFLLNISTTTTSFFDNLHGGFFFALCENIGVTNITLFWSCMNNISIFIEKKEEEKKLLQERKIKNKNSSSDIYANTILYGNLGQCSVSLLMLFFILVGYEFDRLYNVFFVFVLLIIFILLFLRFNIEKILCLKKERKNELRKKVKLNFFQVLQLIFSHRICKVLFLGNLAYFLMNAFVDNICSSVFSDVSIILNENNYRIFSRIIHKGRRKSIKAFLNFLTSFFTSVTVMFFSLIKFSCHSSNIPKISFSSSIFIFALLTIKIWLKSKIGIFEMFLAMFSLCFCRAFKYVIIDLWKENIYTKRMSKSVRKKVKTSIEMYSSRFAKSILPSIFTYSFDYILECYSGHVCPVYYQAPFYIVLSSFLTWFWNLEIKKI